MKHQPPSAKHHTSTSRGHKWSRVATSKDSGHWAMDSDMDNIEDVLAGRGQDMYDLFGSSSKLDQDFDLGCVDNALLMAPLDNDQFDLLSYASDDGEVKLESSIDDYLSCPSSMVGQSDSFSPQHSVTVQPMLTSPMSLPSKVVSQGSSLAANNQAILSQLTRPSQLTTGSELTVGATPVGQLTVDQLKQILLQTVPASPQATLANAQPQMQANVSKVATSRTPQTILPATIITSTPTSMGTTTVPISCQLPIIQPQQLHVTPKSNPRPRVGPQAQSEPHALRLDAGHGDKVAIKRTPNQCRPKERKSSHNVIEKRYRMSINDKIIELKDILMGQSAKLNKSAVLRKAVETVQYLRAANARLTQQNAALRSALLSHGDNPDELVGVASHTDYHMTCDPLTPSSSGYSPETLQPESPAASSGEDDEMSQRTYHSSGMVDGARIMLCMFMFGILLFNPFGSLFGESVAGSTDVDGATSGSSRTLMSVTKPISESLGIWHWLIPQATLWLLNIAFALYILTKVLVDGEPVTGRDSDESTRYWRHMNQADCDLAKGHYTSATAQIKESLHALGRLYPTTRLELVTCLAWQTLRQVLHRTYIARMFSNAAMRKNIERVKSSKDAAVAYHKLLQLSLTGKVESTAWQQLNLALCAVNLAEASSTILDRDVLAHIYATAAVTVLHTLPEHIHFLARFLLGRTRKQCLRHGRDATPAHLRWLCQPAGHRYLVDLTWYPELRGLEPGFTTNKHPYDPLCTLMQCYRQHLLSKALYSVVRSTSDVSSNEAAMGYLEALDLTNPQEVEMDSPYPVSYHVDDLAHWWSALIAVALHLTAGDVSQAERYYQTLNALPGSLNNADDDSLSLPLTVLTAFKARRALLGKGMCVSTGQQLCDRASQLLTDELMSKPTNHSHRLQAAFQVLACEWLLQTRRDIWEQERRTPNGACHEISVGFKCDLNNLHKLSDSIKEAHGRVLVHTATYRTMLGANPSTTSHILRTNQHDNNYPLGSSHLQSRSDHKRLLLSHAAAQELPFSGHIGQTTPTLS